MLRKTTKSRLKIVEVIRNENGEFAGVVAYGETVYVNPHVEHDNLSLSAMPDLHEGINVETEKEPVPLPPDKLDNLKEATESIGMPYSEIYSNGADDDFDPYVYDGSMSPENYEKMHERMEKSQRKAENLLLQTICLVGAEIPIKSI